MTSLHGLSLAIVLPVLNVLIWHHGSVSALPWDGLKATLSGGPGDPTYFIPLPRTAEAARQAGFSTAFNCSSSNTLSRTFRGSSYVNASDPTVALLYDINGYIAGIQSIIPNGIRIDTDLSSAPFVRYQKDHAVTVYFVDPATICTSGRTAAEFSEQGTGTGLYLQMNTSPKESVRLPQYENETLKTPWYSADCMNSLGTYYWHDKEDYTICKFYPIFLMFTNQQLAAFGFLYKGNFRSPHYEHPLPADFMVTNRRAPRCLRNVRDVSYMHVILVDDVTLLRCQR